MRPGGCMVVVFALFWNPCSGEGQDVPEPPSPVQPEFEAPVSPAGAFLRSVLIPGWGHVVSESYTRGGFYVAAQSAGLWMLWKSMQARRDARSFLWEEREVATTRFLAQGMTDPAAVFAAIEADPDVQAWTELVDVRSQQIEDWAALSIFLVILGGVDAFVAAHLMDYPEPLSIRALPQWRGGGVELSVSVPFGPGSGH